MPLTGVNSPAHAEDAIEITYIEIPGRHSSQRYEAISRPSEGDQRTQYTPQEANVWVDWQDQDLLDYLQSAEPIGINGEFSDLGDTGAWDWDILSTYPIQMG
jgi:hypothetical protein